MLPGQLFGAQFHPPLFAPAVSNAEDPEKLLDQVVEEMQGDLIKMRQAAATVGGCANVRPTVPDLPGCLPPPPPKNLTCNPRA
mgnify:FL=1